MNTMNKTEIEETLQGLKYQFQKHKDDKVFTGDLHISDMCSNSISAIETLTKQNNYLKSFLANMFSLCELSQKNKDKIFRRHINRPGDYMGCGYDFLDVYYSVLNDFLETSSEEVYHDVMNKVKEKINKKDN